jgi:hypothetical protein
MDPGSARIYSQMSRFYQAFFIRVCLSVDGGHHVAGEVVGERDGQIGQPGGAADGRERRRFEAGRPTGNEVTGEKIIEPVKARSRWLALERSDLSVRNLKREETAA